MLRRRLGSGVLCGALRYKVDLLEEFDEPMVFWNLKDLVLD